MTMINASEYQAMAAEHHRLAGMCRSPESREQHFRLENDFRTLADATYAFAPEDIKILESAFEGALRELGLVDRKDPATLAVAKRIMVLAQQGERDPIRLREGAVKGDESHSRAL
jgi:hypothetical protein